MSSSNPKRKFYVIALSGYNNHVLSHRFHFPKTRKEFDGEFGAATDEQRQLILETNGMLDAGVGQPLVIYRRAAARKMLASIKAESPDYDREYGPVLREVGEFGRHHKPEPIINWRVQVSKAPDERNSVKVGTVMASGFLTRELARAYIKRARANDAVYSPGRYDYEAVPNRVNV
ncbi:hypothetical protein [Xanthomonas phage SB3]|uniref:Uncharacterized protein n=1 Tax=Xanthomonas phage SB3 TaxID=3117472 RepID=A0ABZ2GY39_9CAUD